MPQASDEWIRRASTGDDAAVEHLLVRYLPDLVEYLDRHAAHWLRQRESAADLAQSVCREVLVRVRTGRFSFQGEPQFRQWLYRAAVIKLMERARRGGADKRDPAHEQRHVGSDSSFAPNAVRLDTTPSEVAVFHEELARFHAAFAALPARSREVISLKLVDGLAHREIGERLGASEAHSRVMLARALAQLAQAGVGS